MHAPRRLQHLYTAQLTVKTLSVSESIVRVAVGTVSQFITLKHALQCVVRIALYCSHRGGHSFTVHYIRTRSPIHRPHHILLLHRVYYSLTVHQCGVRIAGYCHWRDNTTLPYYSVCGVVFGSTAAYIIGYVFSVKRHRLREVCTASTGTASSSVRQTVSTLCMCRCADRGISADRADAVFKNTVIS